MKITGPRWSEALLLPLQKPAYSPGLGLVFLLATLPRWTLAKHTLTTLCCASCPWAETKSSVNNFAIKGHSGSDFRIELLPLKVNHGVFAANGPR